MRTIRLILILVAMIFIAGFLSQLGLQTSPQQRIRRPSSVLQSCESGQWIFADHNSSLSQYPSMGRWQADPRCFYHEFSSLEASKCLARFGDILMVGDSIQRGLFWSLVGTLSGVGSPYGAQILEGAKLSVKNNLPEVTSFSNVQDQTLTVSDSSGSNLFSVRFMYAAHASDFDGRCAAVNHWFFQCPAPLEEVLADAFQDKYDTKETPTEYGLIYFNVGMWDWRTGVPVAQYAQNLAATIGRTAELLARGRRVLWRHNTAAYPSKFAWPNECKQSKIRQDSRPCNIHTDGLFWYNREVEAALRARNIEVIDAWPATAPRSDLTIDGIHYNRGNSVPAQSAPYNYAWATTDKLDNRMYRVLNNQFLSALCPS